MLNAMFESTDVLQIRVDAEDKTESKQDTHKPYHDH